MGGRIKIPNNRVRSKRKTDKKREEEIIKR